MEISLSNTAKDITGSGFSGTWITISVPRVICHHRFERFGQITLLQVMAGALSHNEGRLMSGPIKLSGEDCYKYISLAAPYLELVEEMTAMEFLSFHSRFNL